MDTSSYDTSLKALDAYSEIRGNQNEMLQFLNEGFGKPISSVLIAQRLFADINARLDTDELPKLESITDVLTLVFLGSRRASLEMYIALQFLAVKRDFYGVNYSRVRIILCDYIYGYEEEGKDAMRELQKIIQASSGIISLEFSTSLEKLLEFIGPKATRKNTLFFAFNFNVDTRAITSFMDTLQQQYESLKNCWIYEASSVEQKNRGEEYIRGRKRLFREVTTIYSLFKVRNTSQPRPPRTTIESQCTWCGKIDQALGQCGGCLQTEYCGVECQISHWKDSHQKVCANFK